MENAQICDEEGMKTGYIREKSYIATVLSYDDASGLATLVQRNKLTAGDAVEVISPGQVGRPFTADTIWDEEGNVLESAPHPAMVFRLRPPFPLKPGDILRR